MAGPRRITRRAALGEVARVGGAACLAGLSLTALVNMASRADARALRPPGALPEDDFLSACVRCGLCVEACPYGAREFDDDSGTMKKCTLCVDRIYNETIAEIDRVPSCVRTCPANARRLGLNTPCGRTGVCNPAECGDDTMCRVTTVISRPPRGRRIVVILTEEEVGF